MMGLPPNSRNGATVVLIRGSCEVASAVAHGLFRAGYAVLLHDSLRPTATRRRMAFTDALYEGCARLEGVTACRLEKSAAIGRALQARRAIPVTTRALQLLLTRFRPDVLIDARMDPNTVPNDQRPLAPLVIGLGPNCSVDENVHLAVESEWGVALGHTTRRGSTVVLGGEFGPLPGVEQVRSLHAPRPGIFYTALEVGAAVERGQAVAQIGEQVLHAPLAGHLCGLARSGIWLPKGARLIEIDPRGPRARIGGITERPARIAGGVLQAMLQQSVAPLSTHSLRCLP